MKKPRIRILVAAALFAVSSVFGADNVSELVKSNSAFAFDLYRQLGTKDGNLFFSPYSISMALAMTQAGARGETEAQITKTLHSSLPQSDLDSAYAVLGNRLNDLQADKKITLAIANSLWPNDKDRLLESYIALLRKDYAASVTPLDFSRSETARNIINRWVEDKTHDKIKDLVPPGDIDGSTALVLVNAIYFYGKWLSPFPEDNTIKSDFHVSPEKTVKIPMMSQTGEFPYENFDTFELLELPYQGDALSMLVVLPKSRFGLTQVESGISQETFMGERRPSMMRVRVYLPKFRITWGTAVLNNALESLGMKDAFDANADFSGMNGRHDLAISLVLHKAFVDVKEEGTEAAAATAVIFKRAVSPAGIEFHADHPFLFLIQDNKTGSILFMGRVVDPAADAE